MNTRLSTVKELEYGDYVNLLDELASEVERGSVEGAIASEDWKPGEIVWLPTQDLRVDSLYQRPPRRDEVREFGNNFSHVLCGQLAVNIRNDDQHTAVVVDGQNRLYGALRAGVELIRCEVWYGLTVKQEAWLFGGRNMWRSAPSALSLWRADIVARKREALELARITSGMGLRIVNQQSSNSVRAIAAVRDIYRFGGEQHLQRVIYVCQTSFAGDRNQYNGQVMRAVDLFIRTFDRHENYSYQVLREKLKHEDLTQLRRRAMFAAQEDSMRIDTALSRAMLRLYNEHRPEKSRLPNWFENPPKQVPERTGEDDASER